MTSPASLKIKTQLCCADEIAMGPGKADLLDAIREHGSISAAGRSLQMSYRRAWLLLAAGRYNDRCWLEALVETMPGSARGGGARVTPLANRFCSTIAACRNG